MSDPCLVINGLIKSFGKSEPILKGVSLVASPGQVIGLVGLNGAGKTTLLRCLMGLLRPDAGLATIFGQDFRKASWEDRQRVGYLGQEMHLPQHAMGDDLADLVESLYSGWERGRFDSLTRQWNLDRSCPHGALSGGQRRRMALALLLANPAELFILDEPAANLDPLARRELISAIAETLADRPGTTVILSTHIIADIERMASHVALMRGGLLEFCRPIDELRGRSWRVQIVFEQEPPSDFKVPGAWKVERRGVVVSALVEVDKPDHTGWAPPGAKVHWQPLGLEDCLIERLGNRSRLEEVLS